MALAPEPLLAGRLFPVDAGHMLGRRDGRSRDAMAIPTSGEVVDAFLRALAERDFERARTFLSGACFHARSPIDSFDDADRYVADIARVGPILERIVRRKLFADGADVCAVVEFVTRMDRRYVSPVVFVMRVEDGKIVAIESFFDASGYAEMFDSDARARD